MARGLAAALQRRLSLAILVASGANVLILDEPTNHLDVESREALEDALLAYQGAVLLISHDRALLEAVGTRTIVCEGGALANHAMHWADYRAMEEERESELRQEKAAAKSSGGTGSGRGGKAGNGAGAAGPSKNALRKIADLEREIERAEAELHKLDDELADPSAWSSPGRIERATKRHAEAKKRVEELLEAWETAGSAAGS